MNYFKRKIQVTLDRIRTSSIGIRFSEKYPGLSNFIFKRFSLDKFIGLPTTFLIVVLLTNLFLLSELAENIQDSKEIEWLDLTANKGINLIRSDKLDKVLYTFTFLAATISVNILVGLTCLFLLFKKQYIIIGGLVTAWVGAGITSSIAKNVFKRLRPSTDFYYVEESYSFPSGHATITIAVYGFLFYAFILKNKGIKKKTAWWWFILLFILLMGFSRIYLGVHFFSDVVGGYILGFIWLLLAIAFVEYKQDGSIQ